MTLTYITEGIHSGKSEFAEQPSAANRGNLLYVAFGKETFAVLSGIPLRWKL